MKLGQQQFLWLAEKNPVFQSHRPLLLLACILGAAANCAFFAFVHQPAFDHDVNWLAVVLFLVLAGWVPFTRLQILISNLAVLTSMSVMVYVITFTGGINSPAMVWMTILGVPALLLLPKRWAYFWFIMILLVCLLQYEGVVNGHIDGSVVKDESIIFWVISTKLSVVMTLLLAVVVYDILQRREIQKIERSNQALEETQAALIQAQSHKDEFIASVGHELRTPMNAILGLNGVLVNELADQPENAAIAKHIGESTTGLLALVNDILDFSQLEAGRLLLVEKPVSIHEFTVEVIKPFQQKAADKKLAFKLQIDESLPTRLVIDKVRVKQLIVNLLDNALKFTDQGSISLLIKAANQFVRIEISDTGRGISPDRQKDVFKRFEHADLQTNRAYGGIGLGLAICERLVRLQGGQIGVISTPEIGSTFWFELPLKVEQFNESKPAQPDVEINALMHLKILLVDDNAVNLMVASLMLKKSWSQCEIVTASSGEKALELVDKEDFDLIFMDVIMNGLDGLATTQKIRQHTEKTKATLPIIGLTANDSPKDREKCLEAGMNEMLTKPMDPQAVLQCVRSFALAKKIAP